MGQSTILREKPLFIAQTVPEYEIALFELAEEISHSDDVTSNKKCYTEFNRLLRKLCKRHELERRLLLERRILGKRINVPFLLPKYVKNRKKILIIGGIHPKESLTSLATLACYGINENIDLYSVPVITPTNFVFATNKYYDIFYDSINFSRAPRTLGGLFKIARASGLELRGSENIFDGDEYWGVRSAIPYNYWAARRHSLFINEVQVEYNSLRRVLKNRKFDLVIEFHDSEVPFDLSIFNSKQLEYARRIAKIVASRYPVIEPESELAKYENVVERGIVLDKPYEDGINEYCLKRGIEYLTVELDRRDPTRPLEQAKLLIEQI